MLKPPDFDLSHLSREDIARVKKLTQNPETRAMLYIVAAKIPWELANALTFDEKMSFSKAIARVQDSDFDWNTMKLTRLRGKDLSNIDD